MISACSIFKPKGTTEKPSDKPGTDTSLTLIDSVKIDSVVIDKPSKKKTVNIAILLPFSIDDQFIANFDYDFRKIPYRPLLSLEYYEGLLMGFNAWKSNGPRIQIKVYNTKNSIKEIRDLLESGELDGMNLIIGPLFPSKLNLVSKWSVEHKIPMISPISSKIVLDHNNPYYINMSPAPESHFRGMAKFFAHKYEDRRPLIIRQDSLEVQIAEVFKNVLEEESKKFNEIKPYDEKVLELTGEISLVDLEDTDSNLIFIASNSEVFSINVIRELDYLKKDRNFVLMGMPNWLSNFNTIRFDQMTNLNYHCSQAHFLDTSSQAYKYVRLEYDSIYGFPPSDYVHQGYNQAYFIGSIIHKHGKNFLKHLEGNHDKGLSEIFEFEKVRESGQGNKTHHIENRHINIFRYKNYRLIPQTH